MRIGDTHLGVRTNSRSVADLLEALVPAHVIDEPHLVDERGPGPNFSLLVGDDSTHARPIHFLTRSGIGVVRSPTVGRLVRALLHHLSDYVDPTRRDVVRVDAHVLLKGSDAVLVHPGVVTNLHAMERRLNRLGCRLVDVAGADISVRTGELCLEPSRLEIDEGRWRDLLRLHPVAEPEVAIDRPVRHRVRAWLLPVDQIAASVPDTPAGQTLALSTQVSSLSPPPVHLALHAVAAMLRDADLHLVARRHDRAGAEAVLAGI